MVGAYLHGAVAPGVGRMGALVGLQCTGERIRADAAAAAQELGNKLAMQVVAMRPPYLSRQTGENEMERRRKTGRRKGNR